MATEFIKTAAKNPVNETLFREWFSDRVSSRVRREAMTDSDVVKRKQSDPVDEGGESPSLVELVASS